MFLFKFILSHFLGLQNINFQGWKYFKLNDPSKIRIGTKHLIKIPGPTVNHQFFKSLFFSRSRLSMNLSIHQKLNGTESQRTPDQVSCDRAIRLDTLVFSGSVQWVLWVRFLGFNHQSTFHSSFRMVWVFILALKSPEIHRSAVRHWCLCRCVAATSVS